MKNATTLALICLLALFNACDTLLNQDPKFEPSNEMEITASQMEMTVVPTTLYFENEQYDVSLNDQPLILVAQGDTALSFLTPAIEAGMYVIDVEDLDLRIHLTIKETNLPQSPDVFINELITELNIKILAFEDSLGSDEKLNGALLSFKKATEMATEQEKLEFALFYQANKEAFDVLLNEQLNSKAAFTSEFKKAVAIFIVSLVGAVESGQVLFSPASVNPYVLAGSLTIFLVSLKGIDYAYFKAKNAPVKVFENTISDIEDEWNNAPQLKSATSTLKFLNKEANVISLNSRVSSISGSDHGSSGFSTFFNAFDSYVSLLLKINDVIAFINEKQSFYSFSLVDLPSISGSSKKTTIGVDASTFGYYSFWVDDSRVQVDYYFVDEGKVSLTLTANTTTDLSVNPLKTTLHVRYKDEYSDQQTSNEVEITEYDPCLNTTAPVIRNPRVICEDGKTLILIDFTSDAGAGIWAGSGWCDQDDNCYPTRLYFKNPGAPEFTIAANSYSAELRSGNVNEGTIAIHVYGFNKSCSDPNAGDDYLNWLFPDYKWQIEQIDMCGKRSNIISL